MRCLLCPLMRNGLEDLDVSSETEQAASRGTLGNKCKSKMRPAVTGIADFVGQPHQLRSAEADPATGRSGDASRGSLPIGSTNGAPSSST